MPNWCANKLWISGAVDSEYIDNILTHIKSEEEDFDFEKVLPYPEEYASRDREMRELGCVKFREKYGVDADDGFNSGGYNWCVQNWGTKWNACDAEVVRNYPCSVLIGFQTAWSPPIPVIQKLSELFPGCMFTLQYYECGMAYQGRVKFKEGEQIVLVEGKYKGSQGG